MKLDLGHNLKLPEAVLAQHMAVLGKTRSGKSSVLRLFVEALLERKERVCVLDPKGDWWGLKSSADGKRAGYGVVIFGGKRADIPLNQHAGASVAELVASGNRPCVIDLGGWMVSERTRFFIEFANTLFRSINAPLRLVIDEVHNFAPQGKVLDPDAGKMLHWANRLASEGAGKGLVILSASQRPQKVHKDFLTCAETLVAMRVIHVLDRTAVKEWIDGAPDQSKGKEVLASLASMTRGEGWVWSPEAGFGPERVKFPLFSTYDSFKAPSGGQADGPLKGWAEVDLDDVRTKLAAVVEEAKANDQRELRRQIAELQKQLKAKAPALADPKAIEAAESRGEARGRKAVQAELQQAQRTLKDREGRLSKIETIAHLNGQATTVEPQRVAPPIPEKRSNYARSDAQPTPGASSRRKLPAQEPSEQGGVGRGELKVLAAIAQHTDGVSREQLSILTGYKRSSRDTYLQRLRSRELIVDSGAVITVTEAGLAVLPPDFEPLPTGDALREYWLAKLPEGERAVLQVLIANWPQPVERDAISDATGYKRSSRDTYLQRLRARKLVTEGRGMVRASDLLFEEAVQ